MLREIVLGAALAVTSVTAALAQAYDWRAVLANAPTERMMLGEAYEAANNRQLRLYVSFDVPMDPEALIVRSRTAETGNLAELMFRTPGDELLEYVTLSTGTIEEGPEDVRLQDLYNLIEQQVYPSLGAPETAQVLGGRIVQIAGQEAIEFVSLFDDPELGPVAARIVGVFAPDDTSVQFFVQQTRREFMALSGPDELSATLAGSMLATLAFQAYRTAEGQLVALE